MFMVACILGTEVVINSFEIKPNTDSASLTWNIPRFPPQRFEISTHCRLFCEDRPYHSFQRAPIDRGKRSFFLSDLRPASLCSVNFFAVFNPGAFDHGLKFKFETNLSSEHLTQYTNMVSIVLTLIVLYEDVVHVEYNDFDTISVKA